VKSTFKILAVIMACLIIFFAVPVFTVQQSDIITGKTPEEQFKKELETLKDERGIIMAGLPRFDKLYGRDALIVSWQLLDYDPEIARKTLEVLSELQGKKIGMFSEEEPGIILHQEKHGPIPLYYGSVDATPLYLVVFGDYFEKTQDIDFIKNHWENIKSAVNWMVQYGDRDKDGFLKYQKQTIFGFSAKGWKDGLKNTLGIEEPTAIVEVQGYQYLALKRTAEIARSLGENSFANDMETRAARLKKDFNDKFWMENEKYFALAIDGKGRQVKKIASNPGHLLFTGIVDEEKEKLVVDRLFQDDLWTPFGIRNHSEREPDFDPRSYHLGSVWPHDNWIIAQGLKRLSYNDEYLKIKKALFSAYGKMGFMPEYFGVIKDHITLDMQKIVCYPQAWSSGAMLNFLLNENK
jgi:predicted glycogen debranching enzyme